MCVVQLLFVSSCMCSVSVSREKKVCHIPAGAASCRVRQSWAVGERAAQQDSRREAAGWTLARTGSTAAARQRCQETARMFLHHQLCSVRLWIDAYLVNSCSFLLSHAQTKTESCVQVVCSFVCLSFICFFMFNLQLYVVTTLCYSPVRLRC